jgi:hypothetical protein
MIRTQISLDPDEYKEAKREAKRRGVSLAELVRRGVRLLLPIRQKNPWMSFCGMVESGNKRSSQEVDEIVYAAKD